MIAGVKVKPLKVIPDERGRLMEILRNDDDMFDKFGQIYITTAYPQVVKAWHYHNSQDDFSTCIKGMIKLVLFDRRDKSPTQGELNEFFLGEYNLQTIKIPRGVIHGWKCISENEAWLVNIVSELYNHNNPDVVRLPWDSDRIPYDWDIRMG